VSGSVERSLEERLSGVTRTQEKGKKVPTQRLRERASGKKTSDVLA